MCRAPVPASKPREEEREKKRQSRPERERKAKGQTRTPNPYQYIRKDHKIQRYSTSYLPTQYTNSTNCILSRKETRSSGTTLRAREQPKKAFWRPSAIFLLTFHMTRERKTTTSVRRSYPCELLRCYPDTHSKTNLFQYKKERRKKPDEASG